MAGIDGNRTHPGRSSRPELVLKTREHTSTHLLPWGMLVDYATDSIKVQDMIKAQLSLHLWNPNFKAAA